jgi:serine/threonine-protein kinase
MADVFLTVAQGTHGVKKLTVVKRLRNPDDEDLVRMFLDEARLAARLNHPNIVHTYEVNESSGEYFIAMEYLEGQPLSAVLKELRETPERLTESLVITIVAQALKGLHYAHEFRDFDGTPFGIVHRDVSPHNLFVTYNGDVKVLDFGIAKTAVKSTRTETGVLKGKLAYMAPEQAGLKEVNRQADIFAVGVILWEMLAWRRLFSGDPVAILNSIVNDEIPSPRTVRPEISAGLEAIVMRALERSLDRRYATAEQMRLDLERYLRSTGNATSDNDLARLMEDLFATTREKTRARIQEYVEHMGRNPNQLTSHRDLPLVDGSSNPKYERSDPSDGSESAPIKGAAPPSRRAPWILAAGTAVALAATLTVITIESSRAARTRTQGASGEPSQRPALARVRVETTPPGALVEWNGRRLALTPDEFTIDPGRQNLILTRDGYEPEEITIDAKVSESNVRVVALRPREAPVPAAAASEVAGTSAHPVGRAVAPRGPGGGQHAAAPNQGAGPAPKPTASTPHVKIRMIDEPGGDTSGGGDAPKP